MTGLAVFPKYAKHAARHHRHRRLMNPARRHAFMGCLYHDRHAERLEHTNEARCDLSRHLFLNLHALGVNIDQPRQLGNADNALAWQIADVNAADDWRDMMFAVRLEANVPQQYDFVVARHLFEGALQVLARIVEIPGKPFLIGADDAGGRAAKTFSLGIVASLADQGPHRIFRLAPGRSALLPLQY
jgi:hypothetical protein